MVLNAYTGDAEDIHTGPDFSPLVAQNGFIAAYPQGTRDANGKPYFTRRLCVSRP